MAGEREAFGPLLLRYYPSVLRLCQRLLGPALAAQDVAQEAALQAFLGLAQLHEPDRFGAWLHAIASNLACMALPLTDGAPLAVLWRAGADVRRSPKHIAVPAMDTAMETEPVLDNSLPYHNA